MRVKLVVAYEGTNYCGWQIQPNGITIEQVLNETLSELLGEGIVVTGASRTQACIRLEMWLYLKRKRVCRQKRFPMH